MAKKSLVIDCPECLNHCVLQGTHVDSASFCPFCGENLTSIFDNLTEDDETFLSDDDDIDYDE